MDIRKIQRTGDMHYLYLPTAWCKEHKIGPASRVGITRGSGGSLIIAPKFMEKKQKIMEFSINEDNLDIINKVVVASYINPVDSFIIHLEKPLDQRKLLDQKRLISVELMEIDSRKITCESSSAVGEPDLLLKTMVNKIKNMLIVMAKNYDSELIQRYEEEVDKTRLMIDKSVISFITFKRETNIRTINLHYISLIAKDLERMVDHLILIDEKEKNFLNTIHELMESLKDIIEIAIDPKNKLGHEDTIKFVRKIFKAREEEIKDIQSYHRIRVKHYLGSISEVLMDWAITNEIE